MGGNSDTFRVEGRNLGKMRDIQVLKIQFRPDGMDREGSSRGGKSLGKTPDVAGVSSLPGSLLFRGWAKAAVV